MGNQTFLLRHVLAFEQQKSQLLSTCILLEKPLQNESRSSEKMGISPWPPWDFQTSEGHSDPEEGRTKAMPFWHPHLPTTPWLPFPFLPWPHSHRATSVISPIWQMSKVRLWVGESRLESGYSAQLSGLAWVSHGELCLWAPSAGHRPGKWLSLPGLGRLGRDSLAAPSVEEIMVLGAVYQATLNDRPRVPN